MKKKKEDLVICKYTRKNHKIGYIYAGPIVNINGPDEIKADIMNQKGSDTAKYFSIKSKFVVEEDIKHIEIGNEIVVFFNNSGEIVESHIIPKNKHIFRIFK